MLSVPGSHSSRFAPHKDVEELRIETARRLLERTTQCIDEIADCCGFGSADVLARAFTRVLQLTPGEYRGRFRSSGPIRRNDGLVLEWGVAMNNTSVAGVRIPDSKLAQAVWIYPSWRYMSYSTVNGRSAALPRLDPPNQVTHRE